ncbi:MR-MLE domain-containing protein [Mycena indigotica]|uniref:MR-MLE domain-containing protein n=1 Tax=Mycena indigotica TaxID=2126181 RepID=A0A8H6SEM0_9AGAR|nr:MR-MLE domain-containing protein [Mycena indigotica]KAF7296937.1 MR-MLE domain-containing protein [Mycena indigotica]
MNTDCDYSSAYVTLLTDSALVGHGMTFTIGRGNDIVCAALARSRSLPGGQGERGVIQGYGEHMGIHNGGPAAALDGPRGGCDSYCVGRSRCGTCMRGQEISHCGTSRLWWTSSSPEKSSLARLRVADAITKEEALARLEAGKKRDSGRQLLGSKGYTDEKVMKVGADPADDLRRGKLIRSLIDNPTPLPPNHAPSPPESIAGKNAGPTGAVLIIDANQIWDLDRNVLSTPRALCQS